MASTVTSTNNLSLRSILEKDKLTGSNFLDWERNLMIVLRHERKWYVLEEPLGEAPPANAPAAARNAHKKHSDDLLDVACLMLATMSPDLQAGLINTNAYDMIRQLRDMFQTQARTERYDATKAFNECKMVKGTSVSDHVMKMKRHLDHLERLGHPVPLQLATDTILNSLSEDYRPFVVNYNMNNMEKTIAELHSMLKTAELNMGNKNKTKDVLMAIQSAPKKGKSKGKGKKVKPNKARTENRCFICNEIGHWRQNCPKRHEAGRNHSSTQQLRKVVVLHIQELEVSPSKKPRHYFESHHIIVVTNYPLKTVLRKPELTGRLAKWSIYLSGFDIEFKPKTAIKSQVLADFVAEFSPGLEPTTCDEIVMISDNKPWILYVDGSSNVRGCGLGLVLKSSQGGNIVYSIRCEFKATNNEAEYEALIAGLDIALRLGAKQLHVRSDSLLVVNQVNGDFQAKDSKMMSYLKAVKDRIARFEQFLIEQIPRDLNMQADALANLGSAFHDPFMENIPILHLTTPTIAVNDEVQMNEEIYNWSLDIWNYLKHDQLPEDKMEARKTRSKASRYTILEDQLYRRSTTGLLLRCVTSKVQINQILQEMHDGECGNHAGGRCLANRISRQGYYWPTLREDAITYVQRCDACQKHSGMIHRPSEPLHSILVPWPFMRWGMDIVGKLPPAPGQKVYLLVLTDYFSKWIEAAAFSQVRDKEVISFIQKNIIYRFGVPAEIMCDNGSQFISDKTRTFCEKRGIKLITSTPRYPQSNGLAESSNKVIINSIRKRLKGAKGKWVEELPSVLWANRTTPRASTGQTPYSLVYGCEAVLPIEAQLPIARSRTYDQNAINLSYDLDALEELREKALRTMAAQKGIVERHFNKKVKAKIFQVGDYVLRHVFQNTQEPNAGKLSIKWEGPYIISKVIGNGAYRLTTMEGMEIPRSWNAHHLKRYRTTIACIARLPQVSHDYCKYRTIKLPQTHDYLARAQVNSPVARILL
ncbi:hypothetical protein OSB04_032077 [Centaurea solstitialis]|uniref:Uncharacterized protein n=1 Tax=Centaurea solstitialis TaxID=347529 RepID=A0AA38W6N7_9ASTR|nr:hypothetical protein OSB04_032077 [Centaurea solstitialis]